MFSIRLKCIFCLFFGLTSLLNAQENTTGYWQPHIDVNYKVATNYKHNFSLAKRNYTYRNSTIEFTVRQIDIAHFSTLKIASNQSIGLGIQYRFRTLLDNSKDDELRFTQQYNYTKKIGALRVGNRLRTEQRITTELTTYRFRYRIAADAPLNGEVLDVGEPYLVISTEALLSVAHTKLPEYDQRVTASIGWRLKENLKFQLGSEFRIEDYTHNRDYVVFLLTGIILAL